MKVEELKPNETAALSKIAEIQATLNNPKAAATAYITLADRFMSQRQPGLAVRAWQQAVRYEPTNQTALRRLAEAYRRGQRPDFAAQALLALAKVLQDEGNTNQAIACCEQALTLRPGLAQARQMIAQLRGGGAPAATPSRPGSTGPLRKSPQSESRPATPTPPPAKPAKPVERDVWADFADEDDEENTSASTSSEALTPAEQAAQLALARMAESFFAEGADLTLESLKAKAIDYQTRGLTEEAVKTYREIYDQGKATPEILYNLGLLYQEMLRFDDAIATMKEVVNSPDYAMAAHFTIGQSYQRKGLMDVALDHFLQAIKIVDLQNVEHDKADDLIKLYAGLADSYEAKGDRAQAEHFTNSLAEFLSNRGWEDKLRELRHRMDVITPGETISFAELLESSESELAIEAMETSQVYLDYKLYNSAIEECYWALTSAPQYLPLHLRIADLHARKGRPEAAVEKFVMVADVYIARGNPSKATGCYENALDLAPLDQNVRSKLIDLHIKHGNIDNALDHYLALADGFYQLGQGERAIEKLNDALRLAPRGDPASQWSLKIQRLLADIHIQRLDWRRAMPALEAVMNASPDDADAGQRLMDLYYKMGNEERAHKLLDDITSRTVKRSSAKGALSLLKNQIDMRPDDPYILRLLGEQSAAAGDIVGACEAWEQLVERFIEEGQTTHAMALLRKMIALKPPAEAQYRQKLSSLLPSSPPTR